MLKISKSKTIKALRCCKEVVTRKKCYDCPLQEHIHCEAIAKENALTIIEEQRRELAALKAFKSYFEDFYGTGLEVANWHENGSLEPFDAFFENAAAEYEEKQISRPTRAELKPCPFCGFEHPVVERSLSLDTYYIACPKCQTKFRNDCSGERDKSRDLTVTAWNRRNDDA